MPFTTQQCQHCSIQDNLTYHNLLYIYIYIYIECVEPRSFLLIYDLPKILNNTKCEIERRQLYNGRIF